MPNGEAWRMNTIKIIHYPPFSLILVCTGRGDTIRGIIALGICAAWLLAILLVGRYPFRGGDFSVMYYRVLRKLIKYIVAMCAIIGGFACGLIVISWSNGKNGFQYPLKSFVVTLTMAMGEFETRERYDAFNQDEDEEIGRTFAMIPIIFMIFSCTITMINLFIAVVIADKNELEETVFRENLFYMARSSEVIKDIFKFLNRTFHWTCSSFNKKFNVERTKETFCLHQVCGIRCRKKKLPSYIRGTLPRLKEIAKQNVYRQKQIKKVQDEINLENAGTDPQKEQNIEKLKNIKLKLLMRDQTSIDSVGSRPSSASVRDRIHGFTDNETNFIW